MNRIANPIYLSFDMPFGTCRTAGGESGYDPQFGARPLKRTIQSKILNALSKDILAGKIKKDATVFIDLGDDGNISFENVAVTVEV